MHFLLIYPHQCVCEIRIFCFLLEYKNYNDVGVVFFLFLYIICCYSSADTELSNNKERLTNISVIALRQERIFLNKMLYRFILHAFSCIFQK